MKIGDSASNLKSGFLRIYTTVVEVSNFDALYNNVTLTCIQKVFVVLW